MFLGVKKEQLIGKIVENSLRLKANEVEMLQYRLKWKLGKTYKAISGIASVPRLKNSTSVAPCQMISSFYCQNFNRVDRFNAWWYSIKWPHRIQNKQQHTTWALIHASIINAWVAWCELFGPKVVRGECRPHITLIEYVERLHLCLSKYVSIEINKRQQRRKKRSRCTFTSRQTTARSIKRKK